MLTFSKTCARNTAAGLSHLRGAIFVGFLAVAPVLIAPQAVFAQSYSFNSVAIEGNNRVDPATILTYAGISRGQAVSAAELNDAYQRLVQSSLFETVDLLPQGRKLVIKVTEFPTIGRISIEGNRRIKDPALQEVIRSQERRIYSPATAEADAAAITQAYQERGRLAATVTPQIIRRDGNRVDLVFDVVEGRVVEIERLSFVGNQNFSDARLRRVLQTKQAGILRTLLQTDTYAPERINFDKQVLTDFYLSRGYVDFRIQDVSSEFSRERNAFFVTFNVTEGQSYNMGEMSVISEFPNVEPDEYEAVMNIRKGQTYSPTAVEEVIARMERVATKKGLNFLRVEPRITRQDRSLELDIEFALVRGPRIFVERIDIEGNATTLDRVVRRQFKTVEGDPFNPREIREAAERVRALGFFGVADVQSAQGSSPDQVVIDVNVEEKPTGAFTFGASYSASSGIGLGINISENNFLGRGQRVEFDATFGSEDASGKVVFSEPAFLGRDLNFTFVGRYAESNYSYTAYQTEVISASPSLTFPVSEAGELSLNYKVARNKIFDVAATSSALLLADQARGAEYSSSVGYQYTFDNRRTGLNPTAGMKLQFGQEFAGLGGSNKYIKTTALASAETRVLNDQVTLRATLEGGALNSLSGDSRVYDRFNLGPAQMRGFAPGGIGPRDGGDVLGGNYYAVARVESEFPLGLPEEYGIRGGLFFDAGSLWGLDNTLGGTIDDKAHLRSTVGVSLFWTTPIGPLRFNFSRALKKQSYDKEQRFDVSISTQF
ncbi:MAG: outer membrane protein assembly factor BamA [Paracoccaceae bacterium]